VTGLSSVPLNYEAPLASGYLRQGEILRGVFEKRAECAAVKPTIDPVPVRPREHPLIVVMSAQCDLLWDWEERSRISPEQAAEESLPRLMPHVLLCDLYAADQLRYAHGMNSTLWTALGKNQNERYHHLPAARIGDFADLNDLHIDFKKVYGLPTDNLYKGLNSSAISRVAVVPVPYVNDLIHRFYAFQSRVAVPD
jgi:hypothetical protein